VRSSVHFNNASEGLEVVHAKRICALEKAYGSWPREAPAVPDIMEMGNCREYSVFKFLLCRFDSGAIPAFYGVMRSRDKNEARALLTKLGKELSWLEQAAHRTGHDLMCSSNSSSRSNPALKPCGVCAMYTSCMLSLQLRRCSGFGLSVLCKADHGQTPVHTVWTCTLLPCGVFSFPT
jgi:hypothetical protein